MRIAVVAVGCWCGWALPLVLLQRRARKRLYDIDYALPGMIDLLVVTVEAGLGFSSALKVAAEKLQGPLGDELRLTMQEQRMGLATRDALKNMAERADTAGMRTFVRAIVQGEQLGVSIGQILRGLAVDMRKLRRAMAEERAHKAPVKMLFPLVFLIFPAMFILLLGPAVLDVMQGFERPRLSDERSRRRPPRAASEPLAAALAVGRGAHAARRQLGDLVACERRARARQGPVHRVAGRGRAGQRRRGHIAA